MCNILIIYMAHKKNNKPKLRMKEGNIHLQIFKNKGVNGTYPTVKITSYRFPFGKYNQIITLMANETERLKKLLNEMPEIKKKGKDEEDESKK